LSRQHGFVRRRICCLLFVASADIQHSYLIPESASGAGALPVLVLQLESTYMAPKICSFGFSQNTLEAVFVKVSSHAADFQRVGDSAVPLNPLGARAANGGLHLMLNQTLAIIYCRLVQLAPKRSFMQLLVFFSLSFGLIILAGCMSVIRLESEIETAYVRQPPLLMTPSVAFKNHLVRCSRAQVGQCQCRLTPPFRVTCPSQTCPILAPCSPKIPLLSNHRKAPD
jgi:hypothetical protein